MEDVFEVVIGNGIAKYTTQFEFGLGHGFIRKPLHDLIVCDIAFVVGSALIVQHGAHAPTALGITKTA